MQSQLLDSAKDLSSRARIQESPTWSETGTADGPDTQQRSANLERQDSAHYEPQPAAWPERRDSAQELQAATEGEAAAAGITYPDTLGDRRDSDTDLGLIGLRSAPSSNPEHAPATPTSHEAADRQVFDSPLHWHGAAQQGTLSPAPSERSGHLLSQTSPATTQAYPCLTDSANTSMHQGNYFGQGTAHLPDSHLQGSIPLTESTHRHSTPPGNGRTVQRRLSRLSPTDSARELSTHSTEPEEHAQLPFTPAPDSAPALAELDRGPHSPSRQFVTDSVQKMEAQRHEPDALSDLELDATGPLPTLAIPPAFGHAGTSIPSRLASGDSARELLIPAASSNQSRASAFDQHAVAFGPPHTLPLEATSVGPIRPTSVLIRPLQAEAAARALSHAPGEAQSTNQPFQMSSSAASDALGERSGRTPSAHTLQDGTSHQQEHMGASERVSAGLVSRSDSASSTAARSALLSLTASPEGPQLLHSATHGSYGGSPPAPDGHLSSPRCSGHLEQARSAVLPSLAIEPYCSTADGSAHISEAPGLPTPSLEAARRLVLCTSSPHASAAPAPTGSDTLISASLEEARHSVMMDLGSLPASIPLPPPTFDWQSDPPPSLEQARAVVLTPIALPSEPDAEAGQTSTDDRSSLTPGRERAISASAEPIRSPFAGPLVGQHSNPLGAKAGIHAPRLQNQDTPRQHLPSPTSARTSHSQPGLQPGGLLQWHMSGVSSGMGPPSDGPLMSPTSPEPSGMSDVSSLTSYHGVPPWPQSSHPAGLQDPAGPADDPSPNGHSSGWVLQGTPANASDNGMGESGLGDSPNRGGSGWMEASLKDGGTHARNSSGWVQAAPAGQGYATCDSAMGDSPAGDGSGWVQMPWDVGNPAGSVRGAGHGPAGPSGSGSQSGFMEGASEPSYREWVPESRTLQEARRLMSGEIQPAPSDFEATDDNGDPGSSRWHAARGLSRSPASAMMSEVLHRQDSAQDLHVLGGTQG